MNPFYKLMLSSKLGTLDLQIEKAINTLESYNRFSNLYALNEGVYEGDVKDLFIKSEKGNKIVHDLFYGNLHIHLSNGKNENGKNEKVISVRIKSPEDNWSLPTVHEEGKTKVLDSSHPNTKTYEVYVWYDVPVLDITNTYGYIYKNGSWDKYFYKSIFKFLKDVENITDDKQFNQKYK